MAEAEQERHEPPAPAGAILVINSGSSSVKFALFADDEIPPRLWSGGIDRIGMANGRLRAFDGASAAVLDERRSVADHEQALTLLLETIEQHPSGAPLAAVGHRVVHGGPDCDCPAVVTGTLEAKLLQLSPLAPLHQPHNLAGIAAVRGARPGLPQVACFDTAFHHGLPRFATLTALPRDFHGDGVRLYGFHSLSCEYITGALRRAVIPRRRRRRRHRRGARRSRGPNRGPIRRRLGLRPWP